MDAGGRGLWAEQFAIVERRRLPIRPGPAGQSRQQFNYSVNGRALLRPDEILTLSDNYLIAFLRGMPPILARRIRWYKDRAFRPAAAMRVGTAVLLGLLAAAIALVVWAAGRRPM